MKSTDQSNRPSPAASDSQAPSVILPWMQLTQGQPCGSPAHVFVGGCERSGTTFLAAQISRWAGFVFLPESYFLLSALRALSRGSSRCARDLILDSWRIETFGLSPSLLRENLSSEMTAVECMDVLSRLYADKIKQAKFSGWVEHTPFNTANVALILEHFPQARFINVVRDGRAVAASILKTDFGPTTINRAALWWQSNTLPGLLAHLRDPQRVLVVRYEDLLVDEATCRQRVLAFLGVNRDEHSSDVPVRVDRYFQSTHRLVSGSPVSSRIDAWRRDLSQQQIEDFEFTAGSSLDALGYEPAFGTRARERRVYRYFDALLDALLSLFWQVPRRVLRRFRSRLQRRN